MKDVVLLSPLFVTLENRLAASSLDDCFVRLSTGRVFVIFLANLLTAYEKSFAFFGVDDENSNPLKGSVSRRTTVPGPFSFLPLGGLRTFCFLFFLAGFFCLFSLISLIFYSTSWLNDS